MSREKSETEGYGTKLPIAYGKQAGILKAVQEELRLLRAVLRALRDYKNRRGKIPFGDAKRAWLDCVEALDDVVRFEAAKDRQDKAAEAAGDG